MQCHYAIDLFLVEYIYQTKTPADVMGKAQSYLENQNERQGGGVICLRDELYSNNNSSVKKRPPNNRLEITIFRVFLAKFKLDRSSLELVSDQYKRVCQHQDFHQR